MYERLHTFITEIMCKIAYTCITVLTLIHVGYIIHLCKTSHIPNSNYSPVCMSSLRRQTFVDLCILLLHNH